MMADAQARAAEVLAAHSTIATGLGEWVCKCSPMEWRPSSRRPTHVAAALAEAGLLTDPMGNLWQVLVQQRDDALDGRDAARAQLAKVKAERDKYRDAAERRGAVSALQEAADALAVLVDGQHPAALNPDQWLLDRAHRLAEGDSL